MDVTEAMKELNDGGIVGVIKPDMSKFVDYFEVMVSEGELLERQVFVDGDRNEFYRSNMELAVFLASDFIKVTV